MSVDYYIQIGLAVDDVKRVQEDGELKTLALQVVISSLDTFITSSLTAGGTDVRH